MDVYEAAQTVYRTEPAPMNGTLAQDVMAHLTDPAGRVYKSPTAFVLFHPHQKTRALVIYLLVGNVREAVFAMGVSLGYIPQFITWRRFGTYKTHYTDRLLKRLRIDARELQAHIRQHNQLKDY